MSRSQMLFIALRVLFIALRVLFIYCFTSATNPEYLCYPCYHSL